MTPTLKNAVGDANYAAIRAFLKSIFAEETHTAAEGGGEQYQVDDASVDAFILGLWSKDVWAAKKGPLQEVQKQITKLGLGPPAGAVGKTAAAPPATGVTGITYMAYARHSRGSMPGTPLRTPEEAPTTTQAYSTFTGELPMVRVPLPQKFNPGTRTPTPLGEVDWDQDHLERSVEGIRKKKRPGYDFSTEHAEIVTPPRAAGRRFASTSIYLCYRLKTDKKPAFFLLEAGHAAGGPRVVYPSKSMDDQLKFPAGYLPTPLTKVDYWYKGSLEMKGNEPDVLHIEVSEKENSPTFMRTDITFKKMKVPSYDPKALYAEAAMRIAAIAGARAGTFDQLRDLSKEQMEIAGLVGKLVYDWEHKPT